MNRIESNFSDSREAKLRYGDGDFVIAEHGDYVRCAVTGDPVLVGELKYWSVSLQEPYVSAAAGMQRIVEQR